MATTTTTRKPYTRRFSRGDLIKVRAYAWATGLFSYPVCELIIHGWMATH